MGCNLIALKIVAKEIGLNTMTKQELPKNHNGVNLKQLDQLSKWMDSKFRIPGTDITFGLDPIIGMVPVLGDVVTYCIHLFVVYHAFRFGTGKKIVFKMLGNVLIDFLIGKIPVLGYFIDFAYKANDRNVKLLREHYEEDKHKGSAWPIVIAAFAVTSILILLIIIGFYTLIAKIIDWIPESF